MCVKYGRYLTSLLLSRSEKLSYDRLFQRRLSQGSLSQFPDSMRRPDRRNEVLRFSTGHSAKFKIPDIRTGKDGGYISTYHAYPRPIRILNHAHLHTPITNSHNQT